MSELREKIEEWAETRDATVMMNRECENSKEELIQFFSGLEAEGIIDEGPKGTSSLMNMLIHGWQGYKDYTWEELLDEFCSIYDDDIFEDLTREYPLHE